jgi:hypothetical protein
MRLHAFALAATVAVACGETLPQAEEPRDAGVDASPDVVDASDAPDTGDEGDAACTSAPCNVEEVAAAKPLAIAASTNAMVWLENAIVYQLVPEKAPIALMTPPNGATGHLAIDDVTVLMTEATGVRRCPTTGGCDALDPSVPIYQLSDAGPIAAGGGEMFVGERSGARRLVRCGLGMNCGTSPDVVAYLPEAPGKLALTTSSVVVALGDFTIRAYLRAGRLDGGVPPPTPLATVVDLRGLASSGAFVYWADGVGGTIGGCRRRLRKHEDAARFGPCVPARARREHEQALLGGDERGRRPAMHAAGLLRRHGDCQGDAADRSRRRRPRLRHVRGRAEDLRDRALR